MTRQHHAAAGRARLRARIKEAAYFGIVGGTGTVLNTAILWLLTTFAGWHYLLASLAATEAAIVSNFFGNQYLTFRNRRTDTSLTQKFLRFQLISLVTVVGTLIILWTLTNLFGAGTHNGLLVVWNLIAIAAMFVANYALNHRITWSEKHTQQRPIKAGVRNRMAGKSIIILALALLLSVGAVSADIVATSQMGYHPASNKQVVVYTIESHATSGTFEVRDVATSTVRYTGALVQPRMANGSVTTCQGGLSCTVGNFTAFTGTQGPYYITVSTGTDVSRPFDIDTGIYTGNVDVLSEFFEVQRQQGSAYHADQRSFANPTFTDMADGSFIMVADQASLTLIRLGHAYRRNPALFAGDTSIPDTIRRYADYLASLQGVQVTIGNAPGAVRLGESMVIATAFVPGPTNLTTLGIYKDKNDLVPDQTVPVTSLCGADNGTSEWGKCINDSAFYYKCQIDEPCLNITLDPAQIGTIQSNVNGYAVSRGWYYEFGCYPDSPLDAPTFIATVDPCQVFISSTSRAYTAEALLGFLEAIPAVNDQDPATAQAFFERARSTYQYIKDTYPAFTASDSDTGFYGAALFLLYDYTGNVTYLQEAHALRDIVSVDLKADSTKGNEFYWEEYITHKDALLANGLPYLFGTQDPAMEGRFFGKIVYNDYSNHSIFSLDRTGERVYQDGLHNRYQNSRGMLIEGLLAAKTFDMVPTSAAGITTEVADAQLAWVTGMNAVQDGVALDANLTSYSFIFGIGVDQPEEFHSRYLLDTGYRSASAGTVIGARGTGKFFCPNADGCATTDEFEYLDAKTVILGQTLGAQGNRWRNETPVQEWDRTKTLVNGSPFVIPGWINGAYDLELYLGGDVDDIYNYRDNLDTYEYTETTNEIVAAAIELFAYLDAQRNGIIPHPGVLFNESGLQDATLTVTTTPANADVYLNDTHVGVTTGGSLDITTAPGTYELVVSKANHVTDTRTITLNPGVNPTIHIDLVANPVDNGTLVLDTTPGEAIVYIDSVYAFTTLADGSGNISLIPGTYDLLVGKDNYTVYNASATISEGATLTRTIILYPLNATLNITTAPAGATISIDGTPTGTAPVIAELTPGTHMIAAALDGYVTNLTTITLFAAQELDLPLTLVPIPSTVTANSTNHTGNLLETHSARYSLTLSTSGAVSWYLNGTLAQQDASGTAHTFIFTPNIFNTSGLDQYTVLAVTPAGNVSWDVMVENLLNPYFQGDFGADLATIHVFTNNNVRNYTHANVTVLTENGVSTVIELDPYSSGTETDWQRAYSAAYGNNNLTRVVLYDSVLNVTDSYELAGTERVHWRAGGDSTGGTGTTDSGPSRPGGGGGGGGLPLDDEPVEPELVYTIFTTDAIAIGEEQTLRLDARIDFGGHIEGVDAWILGPDGESEKVALERVQGTDTYGTWETAIEGKLLGKYRLTGVVITTASGETTIRVRDRAFYVGDGSATPEPFGIVYVTLDATEANPGDEIAVRLDATDTDGITQVIARVRTSDGAEFDVPLSLVGGTNVYGTWEGSFVAQDGDTTYSISTITLVRADDEQRAIGVEDRSVYITPRAGSDLLTGAVIGDGDRNLLTMVVEEPLLPSLLAFALMGLIVGAVYVRERIKERKAEEL